MEKKKRFSILKLLLVIICIASIIVSLAINILFHGNNVPVLFGRVIYVVDDNPMENDITTGAALIAKESKDISVIAGDIVLCYPADAPQNVTLRSINYIVETDEGETRYFTRDSFHEDTIDSISKDDIVAVCTGYPESIELGKFISFAMTLNGILILLVATSVILLIFIISAIVQANAAKEEQNEIELYDYNDDESENKKKKSRKKEAPLYAPENDVKPNPELERKKMSIADNFSQKQVNPNSPYQKEREKERTMQFKALQGNMQQPDNPQAKPAPKPPVSNVIREEMRRREAEKTGVYNIRNSEPITDNTGIISKSEMEQLSRQNENNPNRPQNTATQPKQRQSASPDISDIIKKSENSRRKKNPSDMSVDDLLKMIEEEKKKL